jgi:small subunit ribosomal protein S2
VGTKRQAQASIAEQSERCGMPYVNHRWLGGTLTNWRTIRERIDRLHEMEAQRELGAFDQLTKREALSREREIIKMNERFGGIKEMTVLPDLVFVIDVRREKNAVDEANKLGIPVVAVVDTNCDPWPIDYIIPANDDAIRAIKLITTKMADAIEEGRQLRKDQEPEEEEITDEDRMYLGEATLAKIRSGVLEFDAEDQEYEIEYEEDEILDYEDEVDAGEGATAAAPVAGEEAEE